jgi:hypothetical protein
MSEVGGQMSEVGGQVRRPGSGSGVRGPGCEVRAASSVFPLYFTVMDLIARTVPVISDGDRAGFAKTGLI